MFPSLNLCGPNRDRPLTERLGDRAFGQQVLPVEFVPPPPLHRPDPVGNMLGRAPKPPNTTDAVRTLTDALLAAPECEERNTLLRELHDWAERVDALLIRARKEHRAELRKREEELNTQCRAILDRLNALRVDAAALDSRMHALQERVGTALTRLRVAEGSRPHPDSFPTNEELSLWKSTVAKAKGAYEREVGPRDALRAQLDRNAGERRAARAELAQLKAQLQDCRDELAGRDRKGPFGLTIPAV